MYFIGYKNPKILQVFPTDIVEKPLNHPVNPFKHLQCRDSLCSLFCSYSTPIYENMLCNLVIFNKLTNRYLLFDCFLF